MSFGLLEHIFKHLESLELLTHDSVVIDFMAGTGRTGTMAALRRYRTISVELEPHFVEMIIGYDCDGKTISDFKIEPCVCKSDTLHRPHTIRTGLFEVECSGNPRIIPVCRCGTKVHHKKHHIPGNRELIEQATGRKVKWDVIQGDSRELSKLMSLTELVGVVSPPYQDTAMPSGCPSHIRQLAREGKWDEAIEIERRIEAENVRKGNKFGVSTNETIRKKIEMALEREKGNYSENLDNIGNLKDVPLVGVMTPPYSETQQGGGIAITGYRGIHMYEMGKNQPDKVGQRCGYMKEVHGSNAGNIGNLPDRPIVGITSPPYETSLQGVPNFDKLFEASPEKIALRTTKNDSRNFHRKEGHLSPSEENLIYSSNKNNIGNLNDADQPSESYLTAMLKVYQQAYLSGISPLVVVTKNPTRRNALRRLDLDTVWLLQNCHRDLFCQCDMQTEFEICPCCGKLKLPKGKTIDDVGYEIFDYHRAILFETHRQETLDGDSKEVHKGRISFFKRLSLEKGTTVAQFEDVIFARIPIKCARPISELRASDSGRIAWQD